MTRFHSLLLFGVLTVTGGAASAQIRSFLHIPGVPGESVYASHPSWIDVLTVSVGVSDRVCNGVSLTKRLDKSSPLLSGSALNGALYAQMTIDVERDIEGSEVFLTYLLENVTVSAVQTNTTTTESPLESVHLVPSTIKMTYKPPSASFPAPQVSFTLPCSKK
jgi:type VI secretion system Hcp family effector